jgi:hypothetical protein
MKNRYKHRWSRTVDKIFTMWQGQAGGDAKWLGHPLRRSKDMKDVGIMAGKLNSWRDKNLGRQGNMVILPPFEAVLDENTA